MLKDKHEVHRFLGIFSNMSYSLLPIVLVFLTLLLEQGLSEANDMQLPTRIFKIGKTGEDIPVILLSDLSSQLQSISLMLDSGSSEMALFDDQCQQCWNTFSACPHIKTFSNQTLISYLLTRFRGDYSYMTLADSMRIRFFCVLQVDDSQNAFQTNGILGIRIGQGNLSQKQFIEGNGLKIWRKIIHKIYQADTNISNFQKSQSQQPLSLKYSLLYTQYHTQLIIGTLPQYFRTTQFNQFSLGQQIYTNQISFFQSQNQQINSQEIKKQYPVHFDSGSSVIVLPYNHFQQLFQQLTLKISKECRIDNFFINCPKHSIRKLIETNFSLKISLFQDEQKKPIKVLISLENLIDKRTHQKDEIFALKLYGHKVEDQETQQLIILGVPFFKQYLIQYDIPYKEEGNLSFPLTGGKDQQVKVQYKVRIYNLHFKQKGQLWSYHQHLMMKQQKNIKLFMVCYLCMVAFTSYLGVKFYWWVHQFVKGKRELV